MPRVVDHGYGFFPGGDPRRFSPDSDSTPEELENHRRACEAWDLGEKESRPDCQHLPGAIITSCQFGLGSYTYEEEVSWIDWARFHMQGWRSWLWWRLPTRVQDWVLEREQRMRQARYSRERDEG